jgi:outer membrane lipoprotein LolB
VSNLAWWVRGLPAPDSKSRLTLDSDSRLANLNRMAGRSSTCLHRAERLLAARAHQLHGTDLDVTLVIKAWQPRKLGQ